MLDVSDTLTITAGTLVFLVAVYWISCAVVLIAKLCGWKG